MKKRIMRRIVVLIILSMLASSGFGSRILAYLPVPSPSHHFFFEPILRALGERGHQIDYYSPFSVRTPQANITHITLENYLDQAIHDFSLFDGWKTPVIKQMRDIWKMSEFFERKLCQTKPVLELLSSGKKYDLIIHEGMFWMESANIFKHKFNAPSVALLAVGGFLHVNEFSALVNNPSFMVNSVTITTDRMNFFERLYNSWITAGVLYFAYSHLREAQKIFDECYTYPGWETRPPLKHLLSDQALVLSNDHHAVSFAFPLPPHHKNVGGAVLQPGKPLPKDLEEFIEGAKHGVIYFSQGSLFKLDKAQPHLKNVFTKVFSSRKEKILWKWNGDPWEGLSKNVRISKWFPQQDILAHKNVKLFITHAGLQSVFETVHFGVPVVAIPAFGSQIRGSLAINQLGYGVYLTLDNVTEESLNWALNEVLQPKYKQRVLAGSAAMKDRPMNPVDEGVYWIEYVLRHGNVLQPEGVRLSFVQLHLLDIYAFILVLLLVTYSLMKKTVSRLRQLVPARKTEDIHWKKYQ